MFVKIVSTNRTINLFFNHVNDVMRFHFSSYMYKQKAAATTIACLCSVAQNSKAKHCVDSAHGVQLEEGRECGKMGQYPHPWKF